MSLTVEIKKELGSFPLEMKFETENEVLAFSGASGSGKSMTLKCIAGIETPDKGRIILDDRVLFDSEKKINLVPQKRRVGYLFQQYALFPNMTVAQNIAAGVRSKDKSVKAEAVENIIKQMHLEGLEDKKPFRISGGQQQRVALARIMVNDPLVLLLDEPFSALDPYLRYNLSKQMKESLQDFNRPVIMVSHSIDEVKLLASRMAVIKDGAIINIGNVEDVVANPGSDYAARMINPWGDYYEES